MDAVSGMLRAATAAGEWVWMPRHGTYLLQLLQPDAATAALGAMQALVVEGAEGFERFEVFREHYIALLHVCRRDGDARAAANVLHLMEADGKPLCVHNYNEVLGAHADARDVASATALLEVMRAAGGDVAPNERSYTTALHTCARARDPAGAETLFADMLATGKKASVANHCVVINSHARGGDAEGAFRAYERLLADEGAGELTVDYAHTALLKACALSGDCERAEAVLADLLARRLTLRAGNFNSLLNVYAKVGDAEGARGVLQRMRAADIAPDRVTDGLMVDALWNGGRRHEATAMTAQLAAQGASAAGVLKEPPRGTDGKPTLMLDLHSSSAGCAQARVLAFLRDELPRAVTDEGLLERVHTAGFIQGRKNYSHTGVGTIAGKLKTLLEEAGVFQLIYTEQKGGALYFRREALREWAQSARAREEVAKACADRAPEPFVPPERPEPFVPRERRASAGVSAQFARVRGE